MKLLLYCTKAKPYLRKLDNYFLDKHNDNYYWERGQTTPCNINGKIVAECDFEVEEIKTYYNNQMYEGCRVHTINTYNISKLLELSCLNQKQLDDYLGENNGYAIHIKNLHIFDEPRFIQDYSKNENPYNYIENAPQNMMYAYDVKSFNNFEKKILISIQPQEMCKIANNEQTVLVKKKVLKEMLKNEERI